MKIIKEVYIITQPNTTFSREILSIHKSSNGAKKRIKNLGKDIKKDFLNIDEYKLED